MREEIELCRIVQADDRYGMMLLARIWEQFEKDQAVFRIELRNAEDLLEYEAFFREELN